MKIPLSWLKEAVEIDDSISNEDIESAFIRVGFEVEDVLIIGNDIKGPLVIGKIETIEELTGHKKPIRYVGVDCGESSTRYIVCGARNFDVGDLVVVSLPGAVLPGGFEIAARETYGRTSNGMICSARELGMGEDHTGIIVLGNAREIGKEIGHRNARRLRRYRLVALGQRLRAIGVDRVVDLEDHPVHGLQRIAWVGGRTATQKTQGQQQGDQRVAPTGQCCLG